MDATFHFRRKIGCALELHSSAFSKALEAALANHPWFFLSSREEAQLVWSDRLVQPASPQQRILYIDFFEGVAMLSNGVDGTALPSVPAEKPFYLPSASARALAALLKPLQDLAGIQALQVTGLLPPVPCIPSMVQFYQTIVAREEAFAQPLKKELASLLGEGGEDAAWISRAMITGLYMPIVQGPFLTLTVQTERSLVLTELLSQWTTPSLLPSTPSSLSLEVTLSQLVSQESFIVYQNGPEAPYLRMQRESCLIGQLCVADKQMRVCVVPPDPVFSLLASTEAFVMSGAIYW